MNLRPHIFALIASLFCAALQAAPVHTEHVEAELIAENLSLTRGGQNWLALRLKPEQGWHVYWQNPGDSGLATKLNWTLPQGVTAGDIQWPYPHAQRLGELTNYGYGDETLHLVALTVPASWPAEKPLELKAEAKWLVCSDICIPGSAQLALSLPVSDTPQADARWTALIADARGKLPLAAPQWDAQFSTANGDFSLQIRGASFEGATGFEFFPIANDLVNHNAPQRIAAAGNNGLRLSQKLSNYFVSAPTEVKGVLVVHQGNKARAYQIAAQAGAVASVAAPTPTAAAPGTTGLPAILMFAILGGIILNLMPCVFPVLSLKALSVMQSREQSRARQRAHALAYTAGVMLSCGAVALLLLGLRAGGEAIGWGFQLQSPAFVGALAYLMFALGLSLSGVAEFGTRWMGAGQTLTQGGGPSGSFFTGVLATVVASPCTAPFMGTALGFAITQPLLISLSVFLALGFGLALPFLLLGFFPRLAAFLPRPGAWMETFKQVMAFPLYLTTVWLVWVLARQTSVNGAAVVLVGLVLIGFALWLWQRRGAPAKLLQAAALAAAALLLASPLLKPAEAKPTSTQNTEGGTYSAERLAQLRAEKRTVFVNFTADWCITCKLNERVTLASSRVRDSFKEKNVVWLTGDWTRADPAITQVLEQFGRSGVPLYLMYVNGGEAKVLPQVLTPNTVIESLRP